MKKTIFLFTVVCATSFSYPTFANTHASKVSDKQVILATSAQTLLNRLTEIKKQDVSLFNKQQKSALRTEVLCIQKQLTKIDGGIYLSAGAIILILIILIILF